MFELENAKRVVEAANRGLQARTTTDERIKQLMAAVLEQFPASFQDLQDGRFAARFYHTQPHRGQRTTSTAPFFLERAQLAQLGDLLRKHRDLASGHSSVDPIHVQEIRDRIDRLNQALGLPT